MKKQLYIEIDDKYLILSLNEEVKEICKIDDDKHIADKLRELAALAPRAQKPEEQTDEPGGNGQRKPDEYEGTVVDAIGDLMNDPTIREKAKQGWSILQKISKSGRTKVEQETDAEE